MFSIIFLIGVLAGCAHTSSYRESDLATFVNSFGVVNPNDEKDIIAIAKKHFATHARVAIYVVGHGGDPSFFVLTQFQQWCEINGGSLGYVPHAVLNRDFLRASKTLNSIKAGETGIGNYVAYSCAPTKEGASYPLGSLLVYTIGDRGSRRYARDEKVPQVFLFYDDTAMRQFSTYYNAEQEKLDRAAVEKRDHEVSVKMERDRALRDNINVGAEVIYQGGIGLVVEIRHPLALIQTKGFSGAETVWVPIDRLESR